MIEILFKHFKQNGGTNFNRQYSTQNAVFSQEYKIQLQTFQTIRFSAKDKNCNQAVSSSSLLFFSAVSRRSISY